MTYPVDPQLAPWLDMLPDLPMSDYRSVRASRATIERLGRSRSRYEPVNPVEIRDLVAAGPAGAPDVPVRVHLPVRRAGAAPGLLYIHGGGFVTNDIDLDDITLRVADQLGVVVGAVEYRLAPEHPFPAPVEDCYAALAWMAANAADLGIDPTRLGVAGISAGGCLTAAVALLARDRGGPALRFQLLDVPALDDRLNTPSMRAYRDAPMWSYADAWFTWRSYLGAEPGGPDVSPYAAPARAADLSGLPAAFVAVCQFDPLRDEGIGYARRLAEAGVPTDLRYYPGTFHGSTAIEHAAVSRRMLADQMVALRHGLWGPT